MKHINEFKLNENIYSEDLTSEQKNSIRYAEKMGYKYVGTEMSGKNLCAIVDNGDDEIRIFADGTDYQGLSIEKSIEGYWVDPAGGVHSPDDDDPASMYENLKHLKKFKLNG